MPIRALPNGRPIPPHSLVAIDQNSGRHRTESVVVFNRNSWSPSTGTGGRLQSKRLVVFNRNSWSPSAGVRSQGKYREAATVAERALAFSERVLGTEHPDTLTSVNNLPPSIRTRAATRRPRRCYSACNIDPLSRGIGVQN